jgi:hypothetical protein
MSSSENHENLNLQQKLQQFKDYYLLKTAVIAGCILFAFYVVYSVRHPSRNVYSAAVCNAALTEEETAVLEQALQEALQTDGKVSVTSGYQVESEQDLLALSTLSSAGSLDALIAPEETFEVLAGYGYFLDLRDEVQDERVKTYPGPLVLANGDTDPGKGELAPCGYSLCNTAFAEENGVEDPVIGFFAETGKAEAIPAILDQLAGGEYGKGQ